MSQLAIQIEDRLQAAGYQTQRDGGEVSVLDPVYRAISGSNQLILDHHKLIEVRSLQEAWQFIMARA